MKTTLLLIALSIPLTAVADAPNKTFDVNGPATLVPGTSIGPFKLGMTRAEIDKLGIGYRSPATSIIVTGPYEIALDRDDRVTSISRRMAVDSDGKALKGGVVLNSKTIAPKTSFADLTKRIRGCKAPVSLIGGTVAKCADHTFVGAVGPAGVVVVGIEK